MATIKCLFPAKITYNDKGNKCAGGIVMKPIPACNKFSNKSSQAFRFILQWASTEPKNCKNVIMQQFSWSTQTAAIPSTHNSTLTRIVFELMAMTHIHHAFTHMSVS